MTIQEAISLFDYGKYKEAFEGFADIYNKSIDKQERGNIMSILLEAYYEPNEPELRGYYENNRKVLAEYPYIWGDKPEEFTSLSFLLFPTSEESYYLYDKVTDRFIGEYDGITCNQMRYFFENLEHALKVEDEDNLYNLTFLFDNVRRSEDVAMDNHIYLLYNTWESLQRVMQVGDLAPILEHNKFVFLMGKDCHNRYPVDFKKEFGIDYSSMKPQKLCIDEIERICIFSSTDSHCGNAMIDSLLDWHPNLLTIKEFGLSAFSSFYKSCLEGRSCTEFIAELIQNQNKVECRPFYTCLYKIYPQSDANLPDIEEFLQQLTNVLSDILIPTIKQWFCAFFYANALALKKSLNHRIVPAIFHAPHAVWGCDWNSEFGNMQQVYGLFKYIYAFSVLRRPESMIGGRIKYEINCRKLYNITSADCLSQLIFKTGELQHVDWRRVYHDEYSLFQYNRMVIVRYEDIKTNPKATLYALCEYFNIPWSDMLLQCTHNGKPTIYNDAGTIVSDFDLGPLAMDYYSEYLNEYDRFRIEVVYSEFYQYWEYMPRAYRGFHYSDDEIEKMFEIPFQFERESSTWTTEYKEKRKETLKSLSGLLEYLHIHQKRVSNNETRPCKLLVPKKEYCVAPIYE